MSDLKTALTELNKAIQKEIAKFSELEHSENIIEVCKAFMELDKAIEDVELYKKELNNIYEKFSSTIIPELLENQGLGDSVKVFGRTFSINTRAFFSIPQNKQEKGFPWLESNGLGDLIKKNVNGNSLSSALTELVKEKGIMPPEDCVSTHIKKYISIRKT